MKYRDLRDFLSQLETLSLLRRTAEPVSPHLDMTVVCDALLRGGGPAVLFEKPAGYTMPVLGICSARRSAWRWVWGRKT
jgi:3-octaprenyl-4hydroxybenzoate decarboxylase (EC 4.1.1.-)